MNGPRTRSVSWNTHAILTRASVGPLQISRLADSVPVLPLEEFLSRARQELPDIAKWHDELLAAKSGLPSPPDPGYRRAWSTEADFLAGFRLNPELRIDYVRVLHWDEVPQDAPHNPSREGPPGNAYVAVALHDSLSAQDVLATFADEPDWGMDQDLFSIEQVGYGSPAFGPWHGLSSQAPFHMAFFHEHPLLLRFVPRLHKSFLAERVRLFFRLAGLAFQKCIDYWGWRFTAWALHYLQDLTQPYHATPFPPSLLKLLGRFLQDPHPRGFVDRNRNCLVNHHILFEAAVHYILNQAAKNHSDHVFLRALAAGSEILPGTLIALLHEASRTAARVAKQLDRTSVKLFKLPNLDDPGYILAEDPCFRIDEALPAAVAARPVICAEFSGLVCECLVHAGRVTRYVVGKTAERMENGETDPGTS
jgi:hypothetical protein